MKKFLLCLIFPIFLLPMPARAATPDPAPNWGQWRGPLNSGAAPSGKPATTWSETKNLKWKVKLTGSGTATPIVWGDKIFIASAVKTTRQAAPESKPAEPPAASPKVADKPEKTGEKPTGPRTIKQRIADARRRNAEARERNGGNTGGGNRGGRGFGSRQPTDIHRFVLTCLDRKTGKTLWEKTANEEVPHEGHHRDHGYASASPVTDGTHVWISFGSRGLYCFDMDGEKIWGKDLGDMRISNGFGEGTSPALHGDTLVVQWDHEGDSFIVALNKASGKERWRKPRSERTSWSTPFVVESGGKPVVVASGSRSVIAYDLKNGDTVWEAEGLTANVVPTPVSDGERVYVMSGFRGSKALAITLGKTGRLAGPDGIAWSYNTGTPYVPSPLLFDGRLYFYKSNSAILTCLDAKTGKAHFASERISGINGAYASPVGAAGHVYLLGRGGSCVVIKSGDTLQPVATNQLDERFDASPVVVGNELFLRGHAHLYCIASE